MAGAPLGNTNATKAKRWTEAIQKALARFTRAAKADDPTTEVKAGEALDRIALTIVEAAIGGDWWAVAEIGNRLEGKPVQQIDMEINTRPKDVTANPLTPEQWDAEHGPEQRAN